MLKLRHVTCSTEPLLCNIPLRSNKRYVRIPVDTAIIRTSTAGGVDWFPTLFRAGHRLYNWWDGASALVQCWFSTSMIPLTAFRLVF